MHKNAYKNTQINIIFNKKIIQNTYLFRILQYIVKISIMMHTFCIHYEIVLNEDNYSSTYLTVRDNWNNNLDKTRQFLNYIIWLQNEQFYVTQKFLYLNERTFQWLARFQFSCNNIRWLTKDVSWTLFCRHKMFFTLT